MVNTISHIGIGLLLAYALGLKGRKRLGLVLLSIIPDLDYFSYSLFTLISGSVSHEARNQLFYLLGHREFTHSVFFAFIIALLIWLKTKDRAFTFGGFQAVFLHILLDYTTIAKMRPFYPFSTNESALRAIYPFDPVINILPLLPVFIVAAEYMKNRGKWSLEIKDRWKIKSTGRWPFEGKDSWSIKNRDILNRKLSGLKKLNGLKGFHGFVNRNEGKFYASFIIILLVWTTVFPVAKVFLTDRISRAEGTEISYNDTYPISIGKFLAAYSYDDTRYKLLEVSYWSGVEKSFYVEKVNVKGDVPDASAYAERAGKLYSNSVPQAIDYPVYSISEKDGAVTVILSDARNPYVKKWPYFDTVYRFVFDRESGEYEVYESHYGRTEKKLENNYFE
ncbi:hydrolase [Methanosarcina sp. 1.H.T.1A.1]|uniref:metal-dependent hydrolase n=1 Tax=Methanosarcina sp. 1.H.T.1A.1 TaxID=1483602 RepID=UPI000622A340|nr:metal-dependent hydrolase [Methanosarcina sp. 1.H.T.1A.1]KKH98210.1 hydrolase [Methanosarcina sp. 1.H.T.1A.1]